MSRKRRFQKINGYLPDDSAVAACAAIISSFIFLFQRLVCLAESAVLAPGFEKPLMNGKKASCRELMPSLDPLGRVDGAHTTGFGRKHRSCFITAFQQPGATETKVSVVSSMYVESAA